MRGVALALVLLLAGCATAPPLKPPLGDVPDLRGTWTGTWAGTPLTLVVLEQAGTVNSGGVMLGPWSLSGDDLPALSGVLTLQSNGRPTSINVRGRFGDWQGRLTLVIEGLTRDGEQLVLTEVTRERLRGTGTAIPRWEPQGPVELRMSPATRSSTGRTASAVAGSRLKTSRATPASR
jgi:hypothetical protein